MQNYHNDTFSCRILTILFAISAVVLPYGTAFSVEIGTFPASQGAVVTNAGIPVEFAVLPNYESSQIRYIRIDYNGDGQYDLPNSPNFNINTGVTYRNGVPWLIYSTNTANWQYTGYGENYSYLYQPSATDKTYTVSAVAELANNTQVYASKAITVTAGQSWPANYTNHTPYAGMAGTYSLDSLGVPTTSDFFGSYLITAPGSSLTLNATPSYDPDAQYGDNALRYWWQVGYNGGERVDIYTTEPIVTLSSDVYSFLQRQNAGEIQLTVIDRWGKEDIARAYWDNTMAPPVPIPSTALLLGSAVVALAGYRRRSNATH